LQPGAVDAAFGMIRMSVASRKPPTGAFVGFDPPA
jgi:hypothetical protein